MPEPPTSLPSPCTQSGRGSPWVAAPTIAPTGRSPRGPTKHPGGSSGKTDNTGELPAPRSRTVRKAVIILSYLSSYLHMWPKPPLSRSDNDLVERVVFAVIHCSESRH